MTNGGHRSRAAVPNHRRVDVAAVASHLELWDQTARMRYESCPKGNAEGYHTPAQSTTTVVQCRWQTSPSVVQSHWQATLLIAA